MSEFDKWWEENYMTLSSDRTEAEDIYNLGVESQQAKIDELQRKYDAMYNAFIFADDCRKEWHESYINVRLERDKLQARDDEALIEMKNQLGDEDFCDMQRPDYDAMLHALRNIKGILEG